MQSSTVTRYRVHLLDEATVVERGERVRVWFVPEGDTWVRAADHPEAEVEKEFSERGDSCPPGTIWQRSIELVLAPRTPLLCRVTRPLIEALQTVDYMTKERRTMRRHVEERWFVLTGNYQMTRHREPESFAVARKEHERQQKQKES